MTVQFEDIKSEIVARLVGDLIPFVQQAAVVGTLIPDFERGLFDGQLIAGGEKPEVASLVGPLQSVWLRRFAGFIEPIVAPTPLWQRSRSMLGNARRDRLNTDLPAPMASG